MTALATSIPRYFREGTEVGRFMRDHHVTDELREYAVRYPSMNQVWLNCPRADWMLTMFQSIELTPEFPLRKFAHFARRSAKS